MILIIGGSGLIGRETTKQLLARGDKVRLLARTPDKVQDLALLGASVMRGDLIDRDSLERGCQGAEKVLVAAHSVVGRGRYRSEAVDDAGHRALIDIARASGVSHFVYPSIRSVSPQSPDDFFRRKYKIEEYLKASGLSYTIVRASALMELQVRQLIGDALLRDGRKTMLNDGNKPRNFIAARDAAHFMVLALTDPRLRNRTLEIGGPENLSNNQVAALYGKAAGLQPRITHLPRWLPETMSYMIRPFHPGVSRILHRAAMPADAYDELFDPRELLKEFPMQMVTVEEFVREDVARARGQAREPAGSP